MLSVDKATYAGEYNIHLLFNNGREGTANLKKTVLNDKRPIFSKLHNASEFKKFKVEHSHLVKRTRFSP